MSNRLKDILRPHIGESSSALLVRGYDVVGDVAIIIVPDELRGKEGIIAEAMLAAMPAIRIVAKRDGYYSGEFRTISLAKIAGVGELETLHKEFGVHLYLDPAKVYYSPRSANERYRMAQLVGPGERVLVMFSGIAPLPLMIGKYSKAREIVGIEKNPQACLYARKNLKANRKINTVTLFQGDVAEVIPWLKGEFDRVVMPLPLSAMNYLDLALSVLKENGWLHYYDFRKEETFYAAAQSIFHVMDDMGRKAHSVDICKCGHVSPGKYRICIDMRVL